MTTITLLRRAALLLFAVVVAIAFLDSSPAFAAPQSRTPSAVADHYAIEADGLLTVSPLDGVLANDDAHEAVIGEFQNPSANGGRVVLHADGSFTFTPAAGFTGVDTFTYMLVSRDGQSTATVAIAVGGSLDVANAEAAKANEAQHLIPRINTGPTFTDDPLVAGVTIIKVIHLTELRTAINSYRVAAGLSAVTFTDPNPTGVSVKTIHITELRNALDAARSHLALPAITYTDPALNASTKIKAQHIQELRDAVRGGCPTITVTAPATLTGTAGTAYSQSFTQSGAAGAATFAVITGSMPAGLTLQSNGAVTGTPTLAGSFPVTVQVTDSNNCTGSVATTLTIVAGQPAQLIFTTQPVNTTAGQSVTPAVAVTIEDSNGNTVTTASNNVTISIAANPGGGTLSGTATVAASSGVATFSDLSINKTGTGYTLSAGGASLTATSTAFNITPAGAASLVFSAQPSNAVAGVAIAPALAVTILDAFGNVVTTASDNVTIAIAANPGTGTLSGTTTVVASAGVATFSDLSINKSGTGYTLSAGGASLTATSTTFNITPAAASALAFTTQPTSATAGVLISPAIAVAIVDPFGNTITTASNQVTIAITGNPAGVVLSGTTVAAASAGVASFANLSINLSGTYTLSASATGLTGTTSVAFTIAAGPVDHFLVQSSTGGAIGPQSTGVSFTIELTAQDASGNTATSFNGTADISSTGTLSAGGGTTSAFTSGVLLWNVTISNTGNFKITAVRTGGIESGVSNNFDVVQPPAVLSTTPANGATNVAVATTIAVTFNKSVNASTSSFVIKCPSSGSALGFTLSGSPATTFTLTPNASLPNNTVCQVTVIASQIADTNGTHPASDYVFSFTTVPLANNDIYPQTVIGNMSVQSANVGTPYSVTTNDNVDPSVPVTFFGWSGTSGVTEHGGFVSMTTSGPNRGQFAYDPPAGFAGPTDHFTYTLGGVASATVSMVINGVVWFIDNQAVACTTTCGNFSHPFNSLAAFQAVNDGVGMHPAVNQFIFLYESPTAYVGPVTLLSGQMLIGQDSTSDLQTITGLLPATSSVSFPTTDAVNTTYVTVTSPTTGITLSSTGNNTLNGFKIGGNNGTGTVAGTAIGGTSTGTLTIRDVAITQGVLGAAFNLTNVTADIIMLLVRSSGGINNVSLTNVKGSIDLGNTWAGEPSFSTTSLTGATGTAIAISGGTVSLTSGGTVTQANNFPLLSVSNGHTGTLTFNGSMSATNGTGLQFDNADGAYHFNGSVTLNGGDAGVDITNGSSGSWSFTNGTQITNPANDGFLIGASNPTVTYAGSISKNNAGRVISISSLSGGTETFSGTLSSTGSSTGILAQNNTAGTINFSGTKTLNTSAADAITISGNSAGAAIQFTNGGLGVTTTTAKGIAYTGAGTVTLSGSSNSIATTTGIGISHAGSGTITSSTGMSITATTGRGISLSGAGTMTLSGTAHTITTSSTGGTPIFGSVFGTLNVDGTTLSATGGPALDLSTGAVNIGQTSAVTANSSNSTTSGMSLASLTGTMTVGGGTGITGSIGTAMNISGGTAAINYTGPITKTLAGQLVSVSSHATNDVTLSGALSCTSSCSGISVSSNTSGTISFSNASKTLTTGPGTAVSLANNTGAIITFPNGGLNITSAGNGFQATGGGIVSVGGTGNRINAALGTALSIQNTSSGGLLFDAISSAGGTNGILMLNAGSAGLTVAGTGGACNSGTPTCTGGTINGTTGTGTTDAAGVYLSDTSNVSLTAMRITGAHLHYGIYGKTVSGITLNTLLLDGTYGSSTTAAAAVAFDELSGSASLSNSTIAQGSGGFGENVRVKNATAITLNRLTLDTDTLGFAANTGTTSGVNGVLFQASAGTANVTIQNCTLSGGKLNTVQVIDSANATTDLVFTGNAVQEGVGPYGTPAGSGLAIQMTGSAYMTYQISTNTFTNLHGLYGILFNGGLPNTGLIGAGNETATTGTADGTITSNTFGAPGPGNTSGSPSETIRFDTRGSGKQRVKVADNGIYGYGDNAVYALVGGDGNGLNGAKMDITFVRNTIKDARASAEFTVGIMLDSGIGFGDAPTMCANLGEGGPNDIKNSGSVDFNVPFDLLSNSTNNGAFVKFLNYVGGPDAGSLITQVPEGKIDVQVANTNGITSPPGGPYGFEDFSYANRVGSTTAAIGRPCNLPGL